MPHPVLRYVIFVIFSIIFISSNTYSQQWVKTFNGTANGDDRVTAMVTDREGNIYVTGYATFTGTGNDMYTIKYNSLGNQQWAARYNGPANGEDRAFGIVVDNTGNVIITGYSEGVGSLSDYTTIKYNSGSGAQLWIQRYNTPVNGEDKAFGITVDRVNNIYVTGYITQLGTGADIYTIKYKSTDGQPIWGQTIINPNINSEDRAFGIVVDSLGNNVYLCGYLQNDTTGFDFTVASYDSTGVNNWVRKYNGTGNSDDRAFGIIIDTDENILATGYSTGVSSGRDYTTIKYNTAGDTAWVRRFNGTGNSDDKAFGIVVDADGNSFITGYSTGDTTGTDYLTMKYNPAGTVQWSARYNGPANYQDTALALCLPKNSEFVFVTGGSSNDTIQGRLDILTVKYNVESGAEGQFSRYNSTSNRNDAGVSIAADTSGNVFVGGYTQDTATGYDMLTEKFLLGELSIGINIISTEVPQGFKLYQNYPNPFNPSTKIKFDVRKSANVKITVYDVTGRQVGVIVNEVLRTGTYEMSLTANNLASGLYFYELVAEDYKEVKKMILVK